MINKADGLLMDIKVLKKVKEPVSENNLVTIIFKKLRIKSKELKNQIVIAYDVNNDYLPVYINLKEISSRVPSTLLAKWINANCAEKLLALVDRCYTIERIKDGVQSGKYYFTNKENAIYGLHKIKVKSDGVTYRVVSIDSSLGMQAVVNILNEIGVDIESEYDKVSNKMIKISLKGV